VTGPGGGGPTPDRAAPPRDLAAEWRTSYEEEDKRWSRKDQVRDWLWLGVMLFGAALFFLAIFATEPGLR